MPVIVVLDSGPLWLASLAPGKLGADRCRNWIAKLQGTKYLIVIPEVAD